MLKRSAFSKRYILCAAGVFSVFAVHAAQLDFTGVSGGDWADGSNWSSNYYPTSGDYAVLNTTAVLSTAVPNNILALRIGTSGSGVLNIQSGAELTATASSSWGTFLGSSSGTGSISQTGGTAEINYFEIGRGGPGSYALSGGTLTASRGQNGNSVYLGADKNGGSAGDGTLEISGGTFLSRTGISLGTADGSGTGTFRVLGSGAAEIGVGSQGTGDGTWTQNSGSTLEIGIDAGGVTKILIDEVDGDGGQGVTFEAGALLDVDFYNGASSTGTWTVMELENGDITNNGLAFAAGVDTDNWSFDIDNSGSNGLLTVTAVEASNTTAAVTVGSIAALRQYAASNHVAVTMTPGTYWMEGEDGDPLFLEFSGSDNTFDLTDVHIKVDTQELAGYGSSTDVRIVYIGGTNLVIDGLTLSMEKLSYNGTDSYGYAKEYTADKRSQVVVVTGSNITVQNCEFTTGGSYPYGFGDAFGKGSRPTDSDGNTDAAYISHKKQSGILFTGGADNIVFDNVILNMRSFGHGIFFQQAPHDLLFKNCQVLGDEMADSDDIIAHPVYQEWGFATYYMPIPEDIRISKHEGGFRTYGYTDDEGVTRYVENITITNCVIERMRNAVAMGAHSGYLKVYDTEANDCEMGFGSSRYGTTLYENCKGNARNGPLIYFQYGVDYPAVYEVELTGDEPGHGVWPIALISGEGNQITLTSSAAAGVYSNAAYVCTSQKWREWRHRPSYNIDESGSDSFSEATTGNYITNLTDQILVFGSNATENVECVSTGGVINKGSGNEYTGETLVPGAITIQDTWTYPPNSTNVSWAQYSSGELILPTLPYSVFSGTLLADDAAALGGAPSGDGGTTVSNGTIEVEPGFALQGEAIVISGTGSNGQGAIYSDGQADNKTRISSSSGSITLNGNASIGVGVSGNQLLVGTMYGTGDLTKTGPGQLSMEKSSSFDGTFYVSEGLVKARANNARNDLVVAAGAEFAQNASLALNQGAGNTTVLNGTLDLNARGETDSNPLAVNIGALTGSGLIMSTSTAATQTVNIISTTNDSVFDGTISGVIALNKNGAGTTLELNGTCTHTAGTFVNEGRLGGSGSISGDVVIADGAGLAAELSGSAHDPLTVGGALAFGGSHSVYLTSSNFSFDASSDASWTIVEAGSIAGFSTNSVTVDTSAFETNNALDGGSFSVSESGGALILAFTAASRTAQEEWRFDNFGTYSNAADAADLADPDQDGRNNLVEYGTGSDPNVFNTNSAAVLGFTDGGLKLTLTFNRITDPLLTYQVEANTNLTAGSWNLIWSSAGSSNTAGSVTVEDDEAISDFVTRFLRLKLMN